jgi:class 3 adenylate cyclase/predicted ATPase
MSQDSQRRNGQPVPQADRRQVSALAYDLVDSTSMAKDLDAEDMRALLRGFHEVCTAAVEAQGGRIHHYMGDGAMAFFGYPQAHEDDAERAVRAGLDVVARCQALDQESRGKLSGSIRLAVRVGIATGPVVAGDFGGGRDFDRNDIQGWPPHLAVRLQAQANANSVVISGVTRDLVGDLFDCTPRETVALRGFDAPQPSWDVIRERPYALRYRAKRTTDETPLFSRDEELTIIQRRWRLAKQGEGQVVLITGEPGIGKSRLAAAARYAVIDSEDFRISLQCSPQHSNSAFYPLISRLDHALEIAPSDWPTDRLGRLERLLSQATPELGQAVPLIMHFLSMSPDPRYPAPTLSPEAVRERMQTLLVGLCERLSQAEPLLIVVEDAQWIDPTTQELLDQFVDRIARQRVLLVLTFRPEYSVRWVGQSHVTLLSLSRLSRRQSGRIVEFVAGDIALPPEVVDEIVTKADGIPLFLEELTQTVVGSAATAATLDSHTVRARVRIPASLADSLTARLDQLGDGKYIVQVGSAIGRSFPVALARRAAEMEPSDAQQALERLVGLGLASLHGRDADEICTFKHALIQEAAYQGMLKSTRQAVHRRLAELLRSEFAGIREAAPEVLAQHCAAAGLTVEAIANLREAGRLAAERSANVEAARLLEQAVEMAKTIPEGGERDALLLSLLVALGPVLITTRGPGTQDVQSTYRSAIELCTRLPQSPQHFTAFWGWWRIAAEAQELRTRADKLSTLADSLGAPELLLQAHHCQWGTLFGLGEYAACRAYIAKGLDIYERCDHDYGALYGGHDPKVCALGEDALCLWLMGHPDQAKPRSRDALALAARLAHAGSIAQAKDQEIILHRFRDDADTVLDRAQAIIKYADEQGFRDLAAKGRIFRGWALCKRAETSIGIGEIDEGLAAQRRIGTSEDFPFFCEMAAEGYGLAAAPKRGIELLDEAIETSERTGARYWLPELFRRKGELLIEGDVGRCSEGAALFERAIAAAAASGARMLVLRSAMSAARSLAMQGGVPEARARLAAVYDEFAEGFDSTDLASARELLVSLGSADKSS